jgi:hypothetical protein
MAQSLCWEYYDDLFLEAEIRMTTRSEIVILAEILSLLLSLTRSGFVEMAVVVTMISSPSK